MIEFFKADKNDVAQLKMLWLECFEDTNQAVDLFFDKNWHQMRAFCAKDNDRIVSALYLINAVLNGQKAHYLCGASTKVGYRKRNIMSNLIEFALEIAKQDGDKFSTLVPAQASLYEYYARFGYKAECFVEKRMYSRTELLKLDDCSAIENYDFEQLQRIYLENNFLLWNNNYKKFAREYYRLYGVSVICTSDCFALFEENNGCAEVFYAVSANEGVLAKRLIENSNAERFMIFGKAKENSNKEKCGMIKSLDNNMTIPKDVFIGITLM
ncbi:MAG: GNAT family N-acetyltransferase [Ruminococcus sp.]|nr:GNAT family N-acetyltransferase [Ruminococcus sp.]